MHRFHRPQGRWVTPESAAPGLERDNSYRKHYGKIIMVLKPHTGQEALREPEQGEPETKTTQAERVMERIAQVDVELFHHNDCGYATIPVANHKETWPLRGQGFQRWLQRQFYQTVGELPRAQTIQAALGVLEGKALFNGPALPVYTRLAEHNGAIYLDLANTDWQVVEILPTGWRITDAPPVKFRRARGMLPLPVPIPGGKLEDLRTCMNVSDELDWILLTAWLIATLRPTGPYPVLVLHGEQGSAKSTLARVVRMLVDPNEAALRGTPRNERDLMIAATNGWLITLDNLSALPAWLSDALCRLATGSGFATRAVYSNAEEALFAAQRPIILNGIEEIATRGDLLDRAIILYLPAIPEEKRQDETAFWQNFKTAQPALLGALLDVISGALARLPITTLTQRPRMADFARWACAGAETCGWTLSQQQESEEQTLRGSAAFLYAYRENRSLAHDMVLDASPVAEALHTFVKAHAEWEGTATVLLSELKKCIDDKACQQRAWPKNPRALSNILRRLAPNLRAVGIDITFDVRAGKKGTRLLQLQYKE
jgi:hypothetical protein